MLSRLSRIFRFMLIGCLLLLPPVQAQTQQEVIDDLRQRALDTFGGNRQGASYASMINFAVNPDISTATFFLEESVGVNDLTLWVFRVPLRHVFKLANHAWRPVVQANFAYQTFSVDFDLSDLAPDFPDEESIDATWRTYGGSLTVGVEIPLGEHLVLLPAMDAGIARLENDADYRGIAANTILKPAFDDLVFNWNAEAWLVGVSLGFDYRRPIHRVELSVHGSLTHNYVETFHSSSGLIDFDARVTTLVINAETVIPTGISIAALPLALVVTGGYTTFLGNGRDELGFDHFFESGLALESDLSRKQWFLKKLRLGAKVIYGEDVIGWSTIFGYRF